MPKPYNCAATFLGFTDILGSIAFIDNL
jgi:hypothetical protein